MSDVIDFFEKMGGDAQLRGATGVDLETALIGAGIEPAARAAILAGDQQRLESLIGASHNVCNMINVPEEPEEEGEEEQEGEGQEEKEDEGDKEEEGG